MGAKILFAIVLASCVASQLGITESTGTTEFAPVEWQYRSPVALVAFADGAHLFVAEATAARLAVVDLERREVAQVIHLPAPPTGLVLAPDGAELYVTVGTANGRLIVIDTATLEVTRLVPLGHSPLSPVVAADGKTLFVCNRFVDSVSVVDLTRGQVIAAIEVSREPVSCALLPDGDTLVVANHLPNGAADGDYAAAEVTLVDVASREIRGRIALPNGSTSLREVCLSPDGRHAFLPHILARYHHPTTQIERGWINTNAMSVVDLAHERLLTTVLLDRPERGAAIPWGVACRSDGSQLVVTHAGSHAVTVLDLPGLLRRIEHLAPEELTVVPDDLTFLEGLRTRIDLAGRGPRGVALANDTAYIAEYFSDSVGTVTLGDEPAVASSIALGPLAAPTTVRRGEMLFQDATVCFQEWQACESCHPDGRTDGLNWDLINDGFGNAKNTKSLLLAHATPPAMITGIRDCAETAVRAGQRFILFAARPEEEALALDAFLASMQPVPSPWLENGTLTAAARRGRDLFAKTGCIHCHSGPLHTDRALHDLANTRGQDEGKRLDTPTLVECWRTAPYLHDGRAADLRSMLTEHDPDGRHGATAYLSPPEMDDLLRYVLSL